MTQIIGRRTAIATGAAALLAGCRSIGRGGHATAPADIDIADELPGMMELAGVPGMALATIDGSRTEARGFGVTRAGTGNAVNGDTVFEAASLSKPVFACIALGLAAEGKLDLDRPLREFLSLPATDAASAPITARHLLSHSGGWRNWRNTTAQALTADFTPGSRFGYSGEGFYFLSRVVEKITGQGILQLSRERIFEPLGMTRTSYMWSAALDGNRAEPHTNRGVPGNSFGVGTGRALRDAAAAAGTSMQSWTHEDAERLLPGTGRDFPALPNFLLPNVAGSLMTSANDYARFLNRLLDDRDTLGQMLLPQITINRALRWGLGVGLQSRDGAEQFWHWGDTFGFKNFLVADPARRSAIVVFTNGQNGRAIYERVVRSVRGDQPAFLWI